VFAHLNGTYGGSFKEIEQGREKKKGFDRSRKSGSSL
jgi:hypothetical protein